MMVTNTAEGAQCCVWGIGFGPSAMKLEFFYKVSLALLNPLLSASNWKFPPIFQVPWKCLCTCTEQVRWIFHHNKDVAQLGHPLLFMCSSQEFPVQRSTEGT